MTMRGKIMPWRNPDFWEHVPFIGLAIGTAKPVMTRSLFEYMIAALVPILVGAIWIVPQMEAEIQHTQSDVKELKVAVKDLTVLVGRLVTDVAVMNRSTEAVEEIANTKVKTVEGRLGVLEYKLNDVLKEGHNHEGASD